MMNINNILLIRIPVTEVNCLRELRDFILQSLDKSILVLPEDASCDVMELPQLGGVHVETDPLAEEPLAVQCPMSAIEAAVESAVINKAKTEAEEKQEIVRRLKAYRAEHGPGCFAAVSAKTAHRKNLRISDDVLRNICADGAPKMPIENWRSIGKALNLLEGGAEGG